METDAHSPTAKQTNMVTRTECKTTIKAHTLRHTHITHRLSVFHVIAFPSDSSGFLAALLVGFSLSYSNSGFFSSLLTFYLIGSKATKYKSSVKKAFESDHKEGEGQRNWVQVLCNGGIPTQLSLLFLLSEGGSNDLPIDFQKGNSLPDGP